MAAATSSARAASRPTTATRAPAPASVSAIARPMPRVLPVTRAVLPERSIFTRSRGRGVHRRRRRCRSSSTVDVGRDLLHESLEHRARSHLDDTARPGCSTAMDSISRVHCTGAVSCSTSRRRASAASFNGLRVHVRVDWEARIGEVRQVERGGESGDGVLHQRRVERAADVERLRLAAGQLARAPSRAPRRPTRR